MTCSKTISSLLLVITYAILGNYLTISAALPRKYATSTPAPSGYPRRPISHSYRLAPSPSSGLPDESNPAPYYGPPAPVPFFLGPSPASDPALPPDGSVPDVGSNPPEPAASPIPDTPIPSPVAYPPAPVALPLYPAPVESPPYPAPIASPPYPAVESPPYPAPIALPPYPAVPSPPSYAAPVASPPYAPVSQGIKAAYWPSFDGFEASSIVTSYFTHIYYAFLEPDPATFKLNVTPFDLEKIPEFVEALRARNPPVKTLLSIGGYGANSSLFAEIAGTPEKGTIFINSTIELARQYGFDGLDLDWEYPANDQEMSDLGSLFGEWRTALDDEARTSGKPRLLLTSAVYYSSRFTSYGEPRSYPADAINEYVDWVNPMCYDYHGPWSNFTGANSALNDPNSNLSTAYGIGSWIQAGVQPEKLVMGLPLYGHTWTLQNPYVNGIGAPAIDAGPGDGSLSYSQILEFISQNKATVHYVGELATYYTYAGNYWIGYDDVMSIDLKIQYAKGKSLGGYFFWALGQDKDWTISRLASNAWGR